uniref:SHSP domain-containing protein n=1 Tax=Panagrolaimus sp. JU765 TaxID=591449 RepID=A0AC34RFT1_9BILA
MSIEITHNWDAKQWDWPLQHNDGVVRVINTPQKFEVGLDASFFTPKEIEVKVMGQSLHIHAQHESRSDAYGQIKREVNRTYHLPEDVDATTIKSHLSHNGVLTITAAKKA